LPERATTGQVKEPGSGHFFVRASFVLPAVLRRLLAVITGVAILAAVPATAASQKELQAVRGEVGTQATKDAPFARVFSKSIVGDDAYAVTHAASNGLVVLEDSSQVALGQNTSVQLGRFNGATSTPTTITLSGGTMRFNVTHPAGTQSNYVFRTATSQIAVRGTQGLYSSDPATGDTIVCLACDPGDVEVTVGNTKPFPLLTGQRVFISLAGLITVGAATAATLSAFSGAGLSTSASTQSAFASGIGSGGAGAGAAGAAGAASSVGAIAGVAAAAAAAAVVSSSSHSNPSTPTPTPSSIPGGVTIHSVTPPTPTPSPSPAPPAKKH
jgi:FecR protein